MFERMEISESIYEGLVQPSYKKLPIKMPTVLVTSGKRKEKPHLHGLAPRRVRALASSEIHVDILTVKSKNCLIHVSGHFSEECKVMGDFGTKYDNIRPTKYRGISPVPNKKINR